MWFKVDDSFYDHPKVEELETSAVGLWLLTGTYCARHLTDGFVPANRIRKSGGTPEDAQSLVDAGLWDVSEQDGKPGYQFRNWHDYQPTKAEVESKREYERERKARRRRNESGQYVASQRDTPGDAPEESHQPVPARPDPAPTTPRGPSPEKVQEDETFDKFWNTVPKKVGKPSARKAWNKAVREGTDPETIIAGMTAYARERNGKDPQYTAHPSTWLNDARWESTPAATPKINPNQMNW